MKVALIHDWLLNLGGAERVIIALHKIFPEAPIYTLVYSKKFTKKYLPNTKIVPSILQKIPFIFVIGDKEAAGETINVRTRGEKETKTISLEEFLKKMAEA